MPKKVGHDEGYYAGELAAHVRRLGGTPSTKTADFVEKVRSLPRALFFERFRIAVLGKVTEGYVP